MTRPSRTARADEAGEDVVVVERLRLGYGGRPVIEDVSFRVRAGETRVIVGPSGCGKSTLLKCLIGLLRPEAGKVRVLGHDCETMTTRDWDELRRRMGVSFQSAALLNSLTVGENVALPLRENTRLDANTIRIMTRLKLEQVGLLGAEDKLPSELSGGMRKRAGIARALAMDPRVLFLDEPSAGLDPVTAAGLDELLVKLKSALGLTVVLVTHELESARILADRLLMLDHGAVRLDGTFDDVAASRDPAVRRFFDRKAEEDEPNQERLVDQLTRST
jgi:phospholipid/cholesterol/gamma-HCH transport system ATP-binding protein